LRRRRVTLQRSVPHALAQRLRVIAVLRRRRV